MEQERVLVESTKCKRCEIADSNNVERQKLDQADLDEMVEVVQRLKLVCKALVGFDGLDEVECGTLANVLDREADCVFEIMSSLETRLGI